ncbi:hypothetical protein JMN32_07620 [Fulvivirga sp. 29W222]|uniref:GyrI-like small molecule binding domain-containing protein n=1 Tax=Fulvivirga marina TaxID=2494733 RepID=A0A937G0C1_9BACT|nr:hypothetical protein [Fulvivirga marina]MBL6446171.1 hypothetical protein [Fulvivirga marina]
MLKRILIGLTALLSIVAFIFYYKLGGNQPLEYKLETSPEFYIVGKYFEGRYNDPEAEQLFFDAKSRAERDGNANLTIINYPSKENGKIIKQFIGAGRPQKPDTIIKNIEVKRIPRQQIIFALINSHNFVMPSPEDVKKGALKFALEKGVEIDTITWETYTSDRELIVSFPLKK